jgi:hypothetical protein
MFDFIKPESTIFTTQQIARSFRWLGWTGFWLQALLGFIPILVVVTNVVFKPASQRIHGFSMGLWLAIACLMILLFSIYWCFRYVQLGERIGDRDLRPAKAEVVHTLTWGLVANLGIMAIAVTIAFFRVGGLTYKMLTLPQGATIVAPNPLGTTVGPGALVTPSNMIAIQAMISAIAAGLVGVIVALLLIYQVGQHRNPADYA